MTPATTTRRVFIKRTASTAVAAVVAAAFLSASAFAAPTLVSQTCDKGKSANGYCGHIHVDAAVTGTIHTNPEARTFCDNAGVTSSCELWDNDKCAGVPAVAGQILYCKA